MIDQLEETLRRMILDICVVMYKYGYSEVSVGSIMRLMGISDESCSPLDDEFIILDENLEQVIAQYNSESKIKTSRQLPPAGTTLH